MNVKEYIQIVIDIANNEEGYLEKKSNNNLYDKTQNAGSANYTKYGKEMHDLYPTVMDFPAAWCDCFVDWCFFKAYGICNAKALLNGDFNDYTVASAQLYKNKNAYYKNPMIGDQIFFKNDKRICHTGLVYNVDSQYVYTIEGNTSNGASVIANGGAVCKKKYVLTNNRIDGYGRPAYEKFVDKVETKMDIMNGIDISSNNGKIDFKKAKNAGVQFVVIRATTKNQNPDTFLAEYVKGCTENGIPNAFYKYMYSLTIADAIKEAKNVIAALNKVGVIPSNDTVIYADVEDKTQFALSTKALSDIVQAFKNEVLTSGYGFGLYMSKSPYELKEVDYNLFDDAIWIARYPSSEVKTLKQIPSDSYKPVAKNGYLIGWQFSSNGRVDGINGAVDLDVFYGKMKTVEVNKEYYKTPEFTLIESLNNIGVYSSFENRKKIAIANGITNYTGTAVQNMEMLSLLNEGKLVKI